MGITFFLFQRRRIKIEGNQVSMVNGDKNLNCQSLIWHMRLWQKSNLCVQQWLWCLLSSKKRCNLQDSCQKNVQAALNDDCDHYQGGRLLRPAKSVPAFAAAPVELRGKRGKPFTIQVFDWNSSELHRSSLRRIFVNLAFSTSEQFCDTGSQTTKQSWDYDILHSVFF